MVENDHYRRGVGVMLLNREGKVFVGARIDNTDEAWQMPQGGIDKGEEPWATALRELEEETGIPPHLVERIAALPRAAEIRFAGGAARQTVGRQVEGPGPGLVPGRFLGDDSDVNIATKHPEFREWKWIEPAAAARADRAVQARPVPAAAARVRRLSLRRSEIADAAAD